jgi:hypothetical protein
MFGTVTGILPTGSGATAVSTISSQLTADAPELLAVLAGVFAIGLVLKLVRKWMHVAH